MRAYLIDPRARTVSTVEYSGDYQEIYRLTQCDTFTLVQFGEHGDGVFIDDEGLLKSGPLDFFMLEGYPQPLAGRGLVLGCDGDGESVTPRCSVDDVQRMVAFPPARETVSVYEMNQALSGIAARIANDEAGRDPTKPFVIFAGGPGLRLDDDGNAVSEG